MSRIRLDLTDAPTHGAILQKTALVVKTMMVMDGRIRLRIGQLIQPEMLMHSQMTQPSGATVMAMVLAITQAEMIQMSARENMGLLLSTELDALMLMATDGPMQAIHSQPMEHNGKIETVITTETTLMEIIQTCSLMIQVSGLTLMETVTETAL
jgi:hypothetical protein